MKGIDELLIALNEYFPKLICTNLVESRITTKDKGHPLEERVSTFLSELKYFKTHNQPIVSENFAYLYTLIDNLKLASSCNRIDRLIADLQIPEKFYSAYYELIACCSYLRQGYKVDINENNNHDGTPINEFQVLLGRHSIPVEVKSLESKDELQKVCLGILLNHIDKEISNIDMKLSIFITMNKVLDREKIEQVLNLILSGLKSLNNGEQTIFDPLCEVRITSLTRSTKHEVGINLYYESNKYRAIRDNVKKASTQIPNHIPGVVHVFLPPDQLYDIYSSIENSYKNLKNLVLSTPNVGVLSLDSLEISPDAKSVELKRYLVNNHALSSNIPQDFRVSLAPVLLPPWHPTGDNFTISFDLLVPQGTYLPSKDTEVVWISSPHGETQIRVFIRNTGSLRFDLTIEPAGRIVVELGSNQFARGQVHEYSFSVNNGNLKIAIDNRLIEKDYAVLSSNTYPAIA